MESFSQTKERNEAVVKRREVTDDVVDTIPSWRYLGLQPLIGQRGEELIEASNREVPVLDCDSGKNLFVGHLLLLSWLSNLDCVASELGAFLNKPLRGRESNAAVPAGQHRNFPFQCRHNPLP